MRASMHLARLHNATQKRIKRLSDRCKSIHSSPETNRSLTLSHITIELDNLNIITLREFTISTLREAKTTSGKKIQVNKPIGPEEEIGAYMLSVLNSVKYKKLKSPKSIKRTEEPQVRDPKEIEKILIDCSASNLGSLQNALSLNTSLFRDLKYIRHFYAHRCKDTFIKASNNATKMGILNIRHPDQILQHILHGRPNSVLEEWLSDAEIFYDLLMQ